MLSTSDRTRSLVGSKRTATHRPGWLVPFLVFLMVAVPVGFGIKYVVGGIIDMPRFDKNWCIENRPADSATIALTDRTDPLSDRHQAAYRRIFDAFATMEAPSLPVRARLTVMSFDGDTKGFPRVVDSFCRPPLTPQESESGATKARLEPVYRQYVGRVHDAFDKTTMGATRSDWSPILEAIRDVSRRSEFGSSVTPRRLVIASDFLQHVPGRLTEANNATMTLEAFLKTPYAKEVQADLRGVMIDVLYVKRTRAANLQTVTHQKFIRDWLTAMGGNIANFDIIPE